MSKQGLILEGGAMRGLFSAGVIDVLMEHGIKFDGIIGVSAGAAFGCNYKSHQPGRVIRYNVDMAHNWRFCSLRSLILTGDLIGARFAYHTLPNEIDVFDRLAYETDPSAFYVVATDVVTGRPIYRQLPYANDETFEWVRASASMPLCSKIVKIGEHKLLDGGIADSIPLQWFESQGYNRNITVLTQPLGYRKEPNRFIPLFKVAYRRYPKLIEALRDRHIMYNAQLDYVAQAEADGRTLVIRPPYPLPIGHISHDTDQMRKIYQIGRDTALASLRSLGSRLTPPLP